MREIKFRGKRVDNGEWVHGYYVYISQLQEGQIFTGEIKHSGTNPGSLKRHNVDPATVGQYTGLCDKNGREIYEGDIVRAINHDGPKKNFIVTWSEKRWYLEKRNGAWYDNGDYYRGDDIHWGRETSVIGNVHEHPELLEVE